MKKGAKDFLFKLTANGSDLLQVLGSLGRDTEAASHSLDADNRRLIKQRLGRLLVERTYEDENAILSDLAFVGVTTDYGKPYVVMMVCLANHDGDASAADPSDVDHHHRYIPSQAILPAGTQRTEGSGDYRRSAGIRHLVEDHGAHRPAFHDGVAEVHRTGYGCSCW